MAGGRRNPARARPKGAKAAAPGPAAITKKTLATSTSGNKQVASTPAESKQPKISLPKHVPIPEIPTDSELDFEVLAFISAGVALSSQYLNLYRTVWWLPHSHTEYAMNFYLIDIYVAIFCLLMVGRRLPMALLKKIVFMIVPTSVEQTALQITRIVAISSVFPAIGWCIYQVLSTHGVFSLFCLGYPSLVYFILFGANILPAFELPYLKQERQTKSRRSDHICSTSALTVREEVEHLKVDFNARLKHVLFNSLLVAYYTGFVPCCYAQSALHYDTFWITQHISFVWLTNFSMYTLFCFPPQFCDNLHRAALHLGRWRRMEPRNSLIPYSNWSKASLWQQGAIVKHSKEIYKGEGITNAAEPGNSAHARFYIFFSNPMGTICLLLGVQSLLVIVMFVALVRSSEWNLIISVAVLIVLNFPTQFKVARIYLVLGKVYHAKQVLQGKLIEDRTFINSLYKTSQ